MSYLVLARKWRPQRFDDVVGQAHVTKTLANAIEMDRVAHAFLFSGVRGVGKTSLARIMAKALNCKAGPSPSPCGECDACRAITAGTAVDVIEIDGASNNSVEDIRNLRETVPFRPVLGRFKIYVIDEVHMLSTSAFNALLKTLEEPPPHVKFIFATTEAHKIPITILSRCQRYDFRRIPASAIIGRLAHILTSENIGFDDGALSIIGREAEGSMRDALSILDQVLAAGGDRITADSVGELLGLVERQVFLDLSSALLSHNPLRCLEIVKAVDDQGYDVGTFARGLLDHLRNLVVAGVCKGAPGSLDLPSEEIDALTAQAEQVSMDSLHRLFKHFSEAYESIARSSQPRVLLEMTLSRVAELGELVPALEILKRLERLAATGGGSAAAPPGGSSSGSGQGGDPGGVRRAEPGAGTPAYQLTTRRAPLQPDDPRPPETITPASRASQSSPNPISTPSARPALVSVSRTQGQPMTWPDGASSPVAKNIDDADWGAAVRELKRDRPAMASFLEYGTVRTGPAGMSIAFNREYASIARMAEDRIPDIKKYLRERFGAEVSVSVTVTDDALVSNATRKRIEEEDRRREWEEEAISHPLVRQIQSEFGARVSNVQLKQE